MKKPTGKHYYSIYIQDNQDNKGKCVFAIEQDGTLWRTKAGRLVKITTDKEVSKQFGEALVVLAQKQVELNEKLNQAEKLLEENKKKLNNPT